MSTLWPPENQDGEGRRGGANQEVASHSDSKPYHVPYLGKRAEPSLLLTRAMSPSPPGKVSETELGPHNWNFKIREVIYRSPPVMQMWA